MSGRSVGAYLRRDPLVHTRCARLVEGPRRGFRADVVDDPAAKRYDVDQEAAVLPQRVLIEFYGENPTGAERLAFQAVLWLPESLPDLVDLTDEELHKACEPRC